MIHDAVGGKGYLTDSTGTPLAVSNGRLGVSDSGFGEQSPLETGNSTIIPVTSFIGAAEQNDFPDVMVSCYSDDQLGNLYFDFSGNGTDWRTFPSVGFTIGAGEHHFHTAVKGSRYFRLRWASSIAPTALQIFAYYGTFRQSNAPLNQPLGLDADATVVRPTPSWLDISRGLMSGITSVKKFGRNPVVGTSFVPITMGGSYEVPQSGSATTLRIKAGGNANDTAAGSGAREITVVGLDGSFEELTETIATAGASASSATTGTFTRLLRMYVSASGTYATAVAGSHSGDIVIENGAGGTDWGTIDSTDFPKGQSEIGAYSIPAGTTGYVKLRNLSVDSGKTIDLVFFSRTRIDQTSAPYDAMRAQSVVSGVSGGSIEVFGETDIPFGPYAGPTDLGFMAKVSSGTASVSVEFEIFILDE